MKKASNVIVSRSVSRTVIDKYRSIIENMSDDVKSILHEEYVEKVIRLAEMEANKAKNIALHKDEIYQRPKKDWFLSNKKKEKIQAKKKDPFLGLSRDKHRRKQMQLELEKEMRKKEIQERQEEGKQHDNENGNE